jgi:hypothetical protein
MKRHTISATVLLLAASAASAQSQPSRQSNDILGNLLGSIFGNPATADQTLEADWDRGALPFAQRRQAVEARINAGLRDGSLDRGAADDMRREYEDIVATEAEYAANGGITDNERRDLRQRYRALIEANGQTGSNPQDSRQSVYAQRTVFDERLGAAQRERRITYAEAQRLRQDFRTLVQLEARYLQGGLDDRERSDLDTRLDAIFARLDRASFGADRNPARWSGFETRIAAAERNGAIDRRDAAQIRTELGDLARLDAAYSLNGLNADERGYLQRRFTEIDARIRSTPRR